MMSLKLLHQFYKLTRRFDQLVDILRAHLGNRVVVGDLTGLEELLQECAVLLGNLFCLNELFAKLNSKLLVAADFNAKNQKCGCNGIENGVVGT